MHGHARDEEKKKRKKKREREEKIGGVPCSRASLIDMLKSRNPAKNGIAANSFVVHSLYGLFCSFHFIQNWLLSAHCAFESKIFIHCGFKMFNFQLFAA